MLELFDEHVKLLFQECIKVNVGSAQTVLRYGTSEKTRQCEPDRTATISIIPIFQTWRNSFSRAETKLAESPGKTSTIF